MKLQKIELLENTQLFGRVSSHFDAPRYELEDMGDHVIISTFDRPEKYGIPKTYMKYWQDLIVTPEVEKPKKVKS